MTRRAALGALASLPAMAGATAEKQVDAAFTAWSDIFKALLSAPCTTFEAVQMKANLLLSDKSSAFGGSLEYWESEMLLRSFVAAQS
ncbi:hypothetical protein EOA79_21570 [Mesorhizobium sp. M1A.F.Ca.IN.020.03.2.1]|uniref:hypothetical protein n=1 Tax=unclassified Mesorhizobium TaxID=325217 RepID=UPI000FD5E1A2|nr:MULTISPECIES: hypothetical protein [unclassified Mesorhizobium]RUU99689.1 hypothetical protein EOA79_21570 [Mesorhizobium sp. M1A.F.Ca.IN.020.03.2.1]RWG74240.1 MAG: hypothetical protein EOQ68_28220 [Mesorhizobium sp.]